MFQVVMEVCGMVSALMLIFLSPWHWRALTIIAATSIWTTKIILLRRAQPPAAQ